MPDILGKNISPYFAIAKLVLMSHFCKNYFP